MSTLIVWVVAVATAGTLAAGRLAQGTPVATATPAFDEALAKSVEADDYGMRNYVLVILKTGPTKVPAGVERDEMFRGHMANIARLSAERKLALAGPFAGEETWRGLFILAVADIEEAKRLVATDPVIVKGEMVAEYHEVLWLGRVDDGRGHPRQGREEALLRRAGIGQPWPGSGVRCASWLAIQARLRASRSVSPTSGQLAHSSPPGSR